MRRWRAAAVVSILMALTALSGVAAQEETGHGHGQMQMDGEASAAERTAAKDLLDRTRTGVARFADPDVADAEGYEQITPSSFYGIRAAHFHNQTYATDGALLDPERPEDLMYLKTDDGALELIGVMFLAPPGEGPTPGGPLTFWHRHDDLCAGVAGVVPEAPDGTCPAATVPLTQEMLHVWMVSEAAELSAAFGEEPPDETVVQIDGRTPAGSVDAAADIVNWSGVMVTIAWQLDINLIDLRRRYDAGESIAEMATRQGVSADTLTAAVVKRIGMDLDRSVERGDMTTPQRDLIAGQVPLWISRMIEMHAGDPWSTAPALDHHGDMG